MEFLTLRRDLVSKLVGTIMQNCFQLKNGWFFSSFGGGPTLSHSCYLDLHREGYKFFCISRSIFLEWIYWMTLFILIYLSVSASGFSSWSLERSIGSGKLNMRLIIVLLVLCLAGKTFDPKRFFLLTKFFVYKLGRFLILCYTAI